MKILHVIPSVNPSGGGPMEGVKNLGIILSRYGHSVEVVTLDNPSSDFLENYPFVVHAMGPAKGSYAYASKLKQWLKANIANYDKIIVNGIWQYHSFCTWSVIRKTKIPYFVFTHGMLDPWFKINYPLKHLKKWLYWPWSEYKVLRDAKAVIFTCEEERILAKQSFWLYKANEAVTTYGTASPPKNGSELKNKFISRNPELIGKKIILFLSRIHEKKGCDLLIAAFSKVVDSNDNIHLIIAGPGNESDILKLKNQAKILGIEDKISWLGMVRDDEKWGAFYASDVFCLPSHQENFGIVVAEALACAKPVLISNKVNIWREIFDDKVGFVSDDNIDGTVNNLKKWLSLDLSEYNEMCCRAKKTFKARFHIENAALNLLKIISDK